MNTLVVAPIPAIVSDQQNACLESLSPTAQALLTPHLAEQVALAGMRLWEAGEPTKWVFFPSSGLISIVVSTHEGEGVEVASVGRDGAAAGAFGTARPHVTTYGLVTIGGTFGKIAIERLFEAAERNREIRDLIDRCRSWLLQQAQQLAACNALHSGDRRFARWLITASERVGVGGRVTATQEQIAGLLGIRRATVSLIAQGLSGQGIIDYRRGRISIERPIELKAASCECCERLGAFAPSGDKRAVITALTAAGVRP